MHIGNDKSEQQSCSQLKLIFFSKINKANKKITI